MTVMPLSRTDVACLVARDIPDGSYVNLGIGMPTDVADVIDPAREVMLHSENGILGVGPRPAAGQEDWDLIDAGKAPITLVPGGSFTSHVDSFVIVRGGHLDIAVLGAFQVSVAGDIANWDTGGSKIPAVGGAMDLASGAKQVWAMMSLAGGSRRIKLVRECSYPVTARGSVTRVYTDLGILAPSGDAFRVLEFAPGVSAADVSPLVDAPLGGEHQ